MAGADPDASLLHTPLHDAHVALGARMVPFAGWEMPVQYTGIVDEHRQVRNSAGLFDLSHMGEVRVEGPGAGDALAYALVSDPRTLAVGRAQYSLICAEDGGILDDLIVYRVADERFLVVPNASNRELVAAELAARAAGFDATVTDASLDTALIAIQGPRALAILQPLVDRPIDDLRNYAAREARVLDTPALVARTGYTGEDGFELFLPNAAARSVWDALLAAGADGSLRPIGLGARDTLRLEAGMPLYGNELERDVRPAEAGLERVVKLDKPGGFVGRDALVAAAEAGPRHQLVALVLREPGIARHGYPVLGQDDPAGEPIGVVTSGTQSPTLGTAIAIARVPPSHTTPGTMVRVAIRASTVLAEVAPSPFYRRPSAGVTPSR
ncbi:MAG: glycine cleavage system aminomethyltransferase GcvT [Chloroflexi bacterium]|nr:glycine cleavage system aminomethyltransferase GcvT [Chloroflexota bacterium]